MAYKSYQLFVPSGPNGPLFSDSLESTGLATTYSLSSFPNKNRAFFSIFNPKGSNKIIHLSRLIMQISALNNISNTTAPIVFTVYRGTTAPDGLDISSSLTPLDSNYTVPSDIFVYYRSSADSISGFDTFQNIVLNPNLTKVNAAGFYNDRFKNNKFCGIGAGSDIQILTLNQNETFAMSPSKVGNSYVMSINILVSIDNNLCLLNFESTALSEISTIAIRNENATYPVKIVNISIQQYALDTYPNFTIERIDGISSGEDNDTVETLEPVAFDTNYPWPTELICRKNTAVICAGTKDSATIFNYNLTQAKGSPTPFRAITPSSWGITPGVAGGIIGGLTDSFDLNYGGAFSDKNRKSNIILREGDGIAIFSRGVNSSTAGVSARTPFGLSVRLDVYSKEKIYFGV